MLVVGPDEGFIVFCSCYHTTPDPDRNEPATNPLDHEYPTLMRQDNPDATDSENHGNSG